MSDLAARLAAALADRYAIAHELGAGGMATVWLARDLRHDRDVAIKVLHPDLGVALGGDRFLAEIKTTAKLQHPHILPLLDSGAADGLLFYVMPYVKGETLRGRLERERPLPISDALRIAREVGSALDSAHRQGIVHRDIKPENILLLDGQAVVADFGIALAVQSAAGQRMTQTGLSLGTPQYMSPEQAMGERQLDARADVYALGAVTYEMLAGEPPFAGGSVQAIVAKVLSERPVPLRTLRDTVPAGVEQAVHAALAKLPADRPASAAAFVAAMEPGVAGAATATGTARRTEPTPAGRRRGLWLAVAGNAVLAAVAAAAWLRPAPTPPVSAQQVVLWRQPVPAILTPGARWISTQAAIAPDGSSIVFTDTLNNGWSLFRKKRDAVAAEVMAGTEGGLSPCFSADGKWITFTTLEGALRRISVNGGTAITLAEDVSRDYKGVGCLDDGSIVYSSSGTTKLLDPSGAKSRSLKFQGYYQGQLTSISSLPGNRGFVGGFCAGNCAFISDVFVYDTKTDSMHVILPGASAAWYLPSGHLVYTMRSGGLFAARFDLKTLRLVGDGEPVLDNVAPGSVVLSRQGHMLYSLEPGAAQGSELVWVDREGRSTPVDATWRGRFEYPAVAPDGRSVAVSLREKTTELWLRDGAGVRRKVIGSPGGNWRPQWTVNGKALHFVAISSTSRERDRSVVMRVRADAAEPAVPVFAYSTAVWEAEVTPDGSRLVFRTDEPGTDGNIYTRGFTGDTVTRPFAVEPGQELQVSLSPDGKLLAYTKEVEGVSQVFVASFPDGKVRRMISRAGGLEPRFGRSGREVFFESAGRLFAVQLLDREQLSASEPQPLFSLAGYRRARNRQQYDVAPGDQRFLMIKDPPAPVPPVVFMEGWVEELKRKLPQ